MFKIVSLFLLLFFKLNAQECASIIQTNDLQTILPVIDEETVVLWDMDDTLTDSTISLGTGAWRQYIRKKIAEYEKVKVARWNGANLHDILVFYVALNVPVKPVQPEALSMIETLQKKNIKTFVLTGRGKLKWYSSQIPNADKLTFRQLKQAGYRFDLTSVSPGMKQSEYFADGVYFVSGKDKGDFLVENVFPLVDFKNIVFIDDKWDQVVSVEKACKAGRKVKGVYYTRAQEEHKDFDPVIATIQLERLLDDNKVISDQEAAEIKCRLGDVKADDYFFKFLDRLNVTKIHLEL